MLFDVIWTYLMRDLLPWAGSFFLAVTELGGTYAYLLILVVGFWAVNKRETIVLGMVYLFSGGVNYWLKGILMNPRPPQTDWLPGASASGFSLPSGHAQSSTVVYGWLGIKVRRWWASIVFAILIILVGLSRVYLGVHWLGDVIAGWIVGLIIILACWKLEEPITAYLSKYSREMLYLLMLAIGILATMLAELLISSPDSNFGSSGGLIVGFAIGLLLEGKFVNFSTEAKDGQKWRLVIRVILGVVIVVAAMLGLSPLLPSDNTWLHLMRYAIVGIVGTFVWPLIFNKIGL